MTATVLIVDDEPDLRRVLARMLKPRGYETVEASSGTAALAVLEKDTPDVILTDLQMPGLGGLELLAEVRARGLAIPAVVMSGAGTIADAVEALKLGAHDFIEKPVRPERLTVTLETCLRYSRLADEHERLREDLAEGRRITGESPKIRELRDLIARVAPSEGRVLVTGENGTGKELVAEAIHRGSARRAGPFVKLNCSAVPGELVESELFGHEKGSFTGATASRKGRFELADSGTLFLDEVGDMPLAMQVKLLRVVQEGHFERVGGTRTIEVDVRVLAATNRDLEKMVSTGSFREDLFYRLNVVSIRTPPLRERLDDVPLLAREMLTHAAGRNRRAAMELTPAAEQELAHHDYPGNVRELQNIVERLAILVAGDTIDAEDVARVLPGASSQRVTNALYRAGTRLADLVDRAERRIIEEAIAAHDGNKSAAARTLGLERSHFFKKCRKHGVG